MIQNLMTMINLSSGTKQALSKIVSNLPPELRDNESTFTVGSITDMIRGNIQAPRTVIPLLKSISLLCRTEGMHGLVRRALRSYVESSGVTEQDYVNVLSLVANIAGIKISDEDSQGDWDIKVIAGVVDNMLSAEPEIDDSTLACCPQCSYFFQFTPGEFQDHLI